MRKNLWDLDSSVSDNSLGSIFEPWGAHPIGEAHKDIAQIYGVKRSFISTNGTTAANKLALYTLVNPEDKVLMERDCHVSILQALNEIGARPIWLLPPFDQELGINLATTPETIEQALRQHPDIKAVVLTSPKYFGVVGDIQRCVSVCHAHGVPILVDEAHGACFPFHPKLPTSATETKADLISQSTHKTTEAFSQGSILHINNESLTNRFLHALHGTATLSTSFSYPIMATVEEAVTMLEVRGEKRLAVALILAQSLREGVKVIPGIKTWGQEKACQPGFHELDPLRVTLDVTGLNLTGIEVEHLLQQGNGASRPVVAEMGDLRNVLFIVTYGNSTSDIKTVIGRLNRIAHTPRRARLRPVPAIPRTVPEQVLIPREAFWAVARGQTERVSIDQAIGQVSGESVAVYPPGNAILVHGEIVTADAVDYLRQAASFGAHLKGASDPRFETMRVIKDLRVCRKAKATIN